MCLIDYECLTFNSLEMYKMQLIINSIHYKCVTLNSL